MTHVLAFIFGALIILFFTEMSGIQLKSHWQAAYRVGRDDGETIARSQYKLTHEQLEAKCMFFYADEHKR